MIDCASCRECGTIQRTRVNDRTQQLSVGPNVPVTREDVEHALCWRLRGDLAVAGQLTPPGADYIGYTRSDVERGMAAGLSFERAIPDRLWLWLFFEDFYARGAAPTSISFNQTVIDRTQLPGGENVANALAANRLPTAPAGLDILEGIAGSVGLLVGRAFFPLQAPPYNSRSGASYPTYYDWMRSELPEAYWRPAVGFFDDLLGGITSVGGAIASGIGTAASGLGGLLTEELQQIAVQAGANPSATLAVLQQLGVVPGGAMMAVNPDTGSMMTTASAQSGVLAALLRALQTGGAAAAGTMLASGDTSVLGDAYNYVTSLFGSGTSAGGIMVYDLGAGVKPPRRVVYRRPDGRQFEFTPRGRPLLYSSDVAAVKRVQRTASRARRARPRRRALPAPASNEVRVVCGKCLNSPCACG